MEDGTGQTHNSININYCFFVKQSLHGFIVVVCIYRILQINGEKIRL